MKFRPNGIITLTTDFGLQDPFVGCLKGVILSRAPAARVVDLMHGIGPQDVAAAGFWLSRSYRYFPEGTMHVAVVDPGVGSARGLALITVDDHCLLAPDNGLLTPLSALAGACARAVCPEMLTRYALRDTSHTFHGRDVFAPLAAAIVAGQITPEELGAPTDSLVPGGLPPVIMSAGQVQGEVVVVDHFGNLITNIDASMVGDVTGLEVWAGENRLAFHRTYSEAAIGESFALINSFDVVEIACRDGDAARSLGLARRDPIQAAKRQHD